MKLLDGAIDWTDYIIRDGSTILVHDTIHQFKDHLQHYVTTSRYNYEMEISKMGAVDFNAIYDQFKNKKGGFAAPEIKAAIDWFKTEVTEQATEIEKAAKAKNERAANREKALHAAFDTAKSDKLPKPAVIGFALDFLKVPHFPTSERSEEQDNLLKLIEGSENFGTYVSGPNSGLVRCMKDGEPTKFFTENKAAIKFGVVKRAKKNA